MNYTKRFLKFHLLTVSMGTWKFNRIAQAEPLQQFVFATWLHASSWAFAVHQRGAKLLVLLTREPHLLKRAQRGENRAANPGSEGALHIGGWSLHFDFDGLRSEWTREKTLKITNHVINAEKHWKRNSSENKKWKQTDETLAASCRCRRSAKPWNKLEPPTGMMLPESNKKAANEQPTQIETLPWTENISQSAWHILIKTWFLWINIYAATLGNVTCQSKCVLLLFETGRN